MIFALLVAYIFQGLCKGYLKKLSCDLEHPGRLPDMGHRIFKDTSKSKVHKYLNEFVPCIQILVFIYYTYTSPPILRIYNTFPLDFRLYNWYDTLGVFVYLQSILMVLRAITYTVTVLPDSSQVCQFKQWGLTGSCHDLLFSGHVSFTLIPLVVYLKLSNVYNSVILFIYIFNAMVSSIIVISMRKHYTIDVIFAWICTFYAGELFI